MPFLAMLKLWLQFSGADENAFWALTLRAYQNWLEKLEFAQTPMNKDELMALMKRYPDD